VGLDEAHKMLIHKDCKQSTVHPTKEQAVLTLPLHISSFRNYKATDIRVSLGRDGEHKSSELA